MSDVDNPDNEFEIQEDESLEDEYEKIKKLSEKYRKNRERIISLTEKTRKKLQSVSSNEKYQTFIDKHINYETIPRRIGDFYLKHLLSSKNKNFNIPKNISITVDYYGQNITYNTPVSIASFEGNLKILDSWTSLGANETIKTIMIDKRDGNEKSREFDLAHVGNDVEFGENFDTDYKKNGHLNAMGLPGPGVMEVKKNLLESNFESKHPESRMTLSVGGKNTEEYIDVFCALYYNEYDVTDKNRKQKFDTYNKSKYIGNVDFELNISCPNTDDGFSCSNPDTLNEILTKRRKVDENIPVYVKLSPDFDNDKILELVEICQNNKAGVVLANTQTATYEGLKTPNHTGGASGSGLNKRMLEMVKLVHDNYSNVPIKACGGISNAYDVLMAIHAGTSTAQTATAVFEDMYNAIPITNLELSRFCKDNDYKSLDAFKNATEKERTNIINSYTFRQKT